MISSEATVELARKHLGNGAVMDSSAHLCVRNAEMCAAGGNPAAAREWARKALAYSVGVFHPDYLAATR